MDIPASTPPLSGGGFGDKSSNLSGTLKWLVASAGAIAVAIVAGLQLTSLQTLQPWAALLATVGALGALVAVGLVLFGAARVLAIDTPTITELSNAEMDFKAENHADLATPEGLKALPLLLLWLYERRTLLLGDAQTISALYEDGIVGSGRALDRLRRKQKCTWAGRALDPESPSDIAWLETERSIATSRIDRLEAAAGYWMRREAYQRLVKKASWISVSFVAGIFIFALAPVVGPATVLPGVTEPVPAQIHVLDANSAGVPSTCPAVLAGQIVGGSLANPVVVTSPQGECPALKLEAHDKALIVVPNMPVSPGPTP